MTTPEATVYVIDDEAEVRHGLSSLLRSAGWQVQIFGTAQAFLDRLPVLGVGCILLDVDMPDVTGPQLHRMLNELGLHLPVVYLTGQGSVSVSVQAMKQGALDFLEKPVDDELLLAAIQQAIAKHQREYSQQDLQTVQLRRVTSLSQREREVMNHVITGRLNKQIAGDLGIALKTVKAHRGRVMRKMGVRTVAQLVNLCNELGIGPPPKPAKGA